MMMARSSAVEHRADNSVARGSIPFAPTIKVNKLM